MKKKIDINDFRVPAKKNVNLKTWPTRVNPMYKSKKDYTELLQHHVEKLSDLQRLLYASNRYAVLLIFQAMDAAGEVQCRGGTSSPKFEGAVVGDGA